MALSTIFMIFLAALAVVAVVTVMLKLGYKLLNWVFSRRKHPLETIYR